jgi:FkbM family methyltransferase
VTDNNAGRNFDGYERFRKRGFIGFALETHGSNLTTTSKILCNKAVYSLSRMVRKASVSGTLLSPWHWYRYPFSLRKQVLWSRSLDGWFLAENESAIECMLHMEGYEPTRWVSPREGDVFLDIGGFVGWHAIRAARIVGPSGRVISLEPDPINRGQLEVNLSLNAIANCTISALAAWSTTGEELGWYTRKSPDCCRIDGAECAQKVVTTTIDDLVCDMKLDRLDWIKMDIEGGEIEALKGAEMSFSRYRPQVFVEVHNTVDAVKELLARYNYAIEKEAYDSLVKPHGWYYACPQK